MLANFLATEKKLKTTFNLLELNGTSFQGKTQMEQGPGKERESDEVKDWSRGEKGGFMGEGKKIIQRIWSQTYPQSIFLGMIIMGECI